MHRSAVRGLGFMAVLLLLPACRIIRFTLTPPAAFDLVAPAAAAVDVPLTPAFSWTPSLLAASYSLQVATDPAFASLVVDDPGLAATARTPVVTLAKTTVYYWRVLALNPSGSTLATGAPRSFTTLGAAIALAGGPLNFSGSSFGPNPPPQDLSLTNPFGPTTVLNWTASSDRGWLRISPGSGATAAETDLLTVSASILQTEAWTTSTATLNAPNGQEDGSAVWTGVEMIVWGGHGPVGTMVNTGGRYDPAADAWTGTTSTVNAPSPRWGHSAVWTGTEMILWGGFDGGGYNNIGRRYVPPLALAPGTYTGTITVADPAATNSPQTVGVMLTVGP